MEPIRVTTHFGLTNSRVLGAEIHTQAWPSRVRLDTGSSTGGGSIGGGGGGSLDVASAAGDGGGVGCGDGKGGDKKRQRP